MADKVETGGEKPDSRRIIDNVTQRLVKGGYSEKEAREIAVRKRKEQERG